ncbi:helix-turn-helix domain-containing protein [Spirosoma fluminis]
MTREELLGSREYWITKIQLDLYNQIEQYMKEQGISRTQLADQLNVTKGYVSQLLNGDFDHKVSKLVDLALAIGKVPQIQYSDLQEFTVEDNRRSNNSPYVFKAVYRVNQLQDLPYSSEDDKHSQDLRVQTAYLHL